MIPGVSPKQKLLRFVVLLLALAGLGWLLLLTPFGRAITDQQRIANLLAEYPTAAPLLFLIGYAFVGCTMLPLWPLQGVAGFVFGPLQATLLCQIGNAIAAYITTAASEWMIRGMSMKKIAPVLAKLRHVQRRLGSTGIPLVMATRLAHFTPFGPFNVAFGIMRLRPRDVAIGTLLGNTGSVGFYTILGAAGGSLRGDWVSMMQLIAALVVLNLLLIAPIAVRYWRSRDGGELSVSTVSVVAARER
ncbi:MAG TPA: VTT domain-containing protein [Tepidisphaeraceae bacterium]|nr:VTT domain-containing protein [Tepidisphaeraceae bacterium]